MKDVHFYLEMAAFIVTIIGLPVAIISYVREQKSQREEREYGTYDALDDKYIELQQLCLNYPNLDIFDSPYTRETPLSEEEQKQEEAILLIRIAIFERAYLMYMRTPDTVKSSQWEGWEAEILEWLTRENYRRVWQQHKPYYDKAFVQYFDDKSDSSE